jgi:hypothetical protein
MDFFMTAFLLSVLIGFAVYLFEQFSKLVQRLDDVVERFVQVFTSYFVNFTAPRFEPSGQFSPSRYEKA